MAVNQAGVSSVDEVLAAVKRTPDALSLNILRGNSEVMIVIQ